MKLRSRRIAFCAGLGLVLGLAGCSSTSVPATSDAGPASETPVRGDTDPVPFGGARPVDLYVPTAYSPEKPAPLVVLLHGYGASGKVQELYFGLRGHAESRGFLFAHPDGTIDKTGKRFWNASECCDFASSGVDDVAYLDGLVEEIGKRYKVDPKRVFLIGHSNGGFMSYRLACDKANRFAAIASLAGTMWADASRCKPSEPVSILHIHGTGDDTIAYEGGSFSSAKYPGAKETVARWAGFNGCDPTPSPNGPTMDIEDSRPGAETTVTKYQAGCRSGSAVELWTMDGAGHLPSLGKSFDEKMLDFLFAHPKP